MSDVSGAGGDTTLAEANPLGDARIAFVGAGVMAESMIAGLLKNALIPAAHVVASHPRDDRRHRLEERFGIRTTESNFEAARDTDLVILTIKPQVLQVVMRQLSGTLSRDQVVVSVIAGAPIDVLVNGLGHQAVVRVMPNTPAQVDEGMAAISAGSHSDQEHLDRVTEILSATGRVVTVPERYQDAVTAISGSGPAYLFFVVEAMIEAGVHLGLPRDISTELVVQTMLGSAKLLRETGEHPTVLRERVTSPGGTTAAAVRQLEDHKVRAAFLGAMEAARDRSRELAAAARQTPSDSGARG